jgi:hypothetical protein
MTSKINQSAIYYPVLIQPQELDIKGNMQTSAKDSLCFYELKQHKTWFHAECSQYLDQRKQAKMQWLQDPNQSNIGNINNVRHENSRPFRNKKKQCLKAKIINLKLRVRPRISETCIGASIT